MSKYIIIHSVSGINEFEFIGSEQGVKAWLERYGDESVQVFEISREHLISEFINEPSIPS